MDDRVIYQQLVLNTTPEAVWRKWTTTEGIQSFFCRNCSIDLKLNGNFELYFMMSNPVGLRGSEGCRFLSYIPGKMLSFSWNAPPEFPEVRNGEKTWCILFLEETEQNKTLLKFSHLGWHKGEEWDKVYDYFSKAWPVVFNNLEKSIQP